MTLVPGALIWIDLELTSLDPEGSRIIEVAMVRTDGSLNELGEPLRIAVHPGRRALAQMSDGAREMHESSGLLQDLQTGSAVPTRIAEERAVDYLDDIARQTPFVHAGYYLDLDRRVLEREMTSLFELLGFRTLDVRSLEEAALSWRGERIPRSDSRPHRALEDVREAIDLAKGYRALML